jgi:hypothetical protein
MVPRCMSACVSSRFRDNVIFVHVYVHVRTTYVHPLALSTGCRETHVVLGAQVRPFPIRKV